uniref:Glycoprotein hormone alpha-2 n=1 Tax=Equus caballus TaxID=9796 RepID=A0A9L0R5V8_HORSE
MGTSSQDSSKKKPPMETRRNRERKTQQEWQETPAFDITNVQDQAFNVTVRSDRQGTCQGSHVAQACVGHCESSAFPSRYSVLVASGYRHNITSVSQCCTISSLSKVKVQLQCGGNRREELEIFTARACQCDMCRLSRY